MKPRWVIGGAVVLGLAALWAANSSRLARAPEQPWRWLAHRGVHQTFPLDGVDNDTCTATRIHPPTHRYLENTIPSMRAAFAAGADRVELDLHATADGQLAVFHDHLLECRTDGSGAPEDHAMDALRRLDVGYGYTADGGQTFPLRGAGIGLMPTLPEVLAALPGRDLILHVKMNRPEDGDLVAEVLETLPAERRARLWIYGGAEPVRRVTDRFPEVRSFDGQRLKSCLGGYLALGWTGWVPASCRDTVLLVPVSHAGWLWGWPRRLERRMRRVGTEVVLVGPWTGGNHVRGIDDPVTLSAVPGDFGGWVWTNEIGALAPARAASPSDGPLQRPIRTPRDPAP